MRSSANTSEAFWSAFPSRSTIAAARAWSFSRIAPSSSRNSASAGTAATFSRCSDRGYGSHVRKLPPRSTRSCATWYAPRMRLVTRVRRSPARAMFRQAFAESHACTPIESPWTLPTGLFGAVWFCGRPSSHSTSRLAASTIASATASGAMPSARAAAAASAACAPVPP